MKKVFVTLFAAVLMLSATSIASAETGVGIQFGEPGNVGLSLRFDNIAIGAGWKLGDNGYLAVDADYWIGDNKLANKLDWFWGLGVGARFGTPFDLSVRVPIGLQFMPAKEWEIFGQLAPALQVIDEIDFEFGGAIGVRYCF